MVESNGRLCQILILLARGRDGRFEGHWVNFWLKHAVASDSRQKMIFDLPGDDLQKVTIYDDSRGSIACLPN